MTPFEKNLTEAIRTMQHAVHQNAKDHGWWQEPREDGTILALIHSEVSEALEALRDGVSHHDSEKAAGFTKLEEELADIIIRVMDYAEARKVRLGAAILAKHEYNKTRLHKHGGKAF